MFGKILILLALCGSLVSAASSEPVNSKTPYCHFNNGIKMTMDRNDNLLLPFSVSWADVDPRFVLGKWSCFYRGEDGRKIVCPEAQKNILLRYEKGFNSGNFSIAADSFNYSDTVTIHLTVSELKQNIQYLCGINIQVQPAEIENIPVKIHSDVSFNTFINMEDSHQFSCDIDYDNVGAITRETINQESKYSVRMYDIKNDTETPLDPVYNEHGNAMLVDASFFGPNKVYVFRCEVNFELNGIKHNGKAWKLFNTR